MGGGDDSPSREKSPRKPKGRAGSSAGSPGAGDPCDIVDEGTIRSPNPGAVRALKEGTHLKVDLASVRGVQVLVAKDSDGNSLGTIDCLHSDEIISCITARNTYEATVVRKQGGTIVLGIHRVKS
jgi:hypothetical protein